jgi:hypothetical protein
MGPIIRPRNQARPNNRTMTPRLCKARLRCLNKQARLRRTLRPGSDPKQPRRPRRTSSPTAASPLICCSTRRRKPAPAAFRAGIEQAATLLSQDISNKITTTFDGLDYIASYGDLIKALGANEQAGAEHFIDNGFKEGRTTTFDGLDYIANYTDLMKAFGANNDEGAAHYITNGHSEGRSTTFSVAAYESSHPDLPKFSSNDAFLTAYINAYKATGTFLT